MCIKFPAEILNMTEVWYFEGRKRPFLMQFLGIFLCFRLSSFVLFGPFKKCFRAIFRVLDETDLKTCLPEPNIQSDLSLTS